MFACLVDERTFGVGRDQLATALHDQRIERGSVPGDSAASDFACLQYQTPARTRNVSDGWMGAASDR